MSESPSGNSEPVQLTERSGAVVADVPDPDAETPATKAQREADARRARAAAAPAEADNATQTESIAAQEGDVEFLEGEWHGHQNHKCPDCHIAFLDIQGGSAAVRAHRRAAHPGGNS